MMCSVFENVKKSHIFTETFWNEKSGSKKVLELFPGLLLHPQI